MIVLRQDPCALGMLVGHGVFPHAQFSVMGAAASDGGGVIADEYCSDYFFFFERFLPR